MNNKGWPKCLIDSVILWVVAIPGGEILGEFIGGNFEIKKVVSNAFFYSIDGNFDVIGMTAFLFFVLFWAAVLHAGRKELFDK